LKGPRNYRKEIIVKAQGKSLQGTPANPMGEWDVGAFVDRG